MGATIDITGKKYGRLTAIKPSPKRDRSGCAFWLFKCDCGNFKEINSYNVKTGAVKSCGCIAKPHGMNRTRIHRIWVAMRMRCKNDGKPEHDKWGNRGIRVCDEWEDFITFKNWAFGNGYKDNLTIDRIDNNKGYSPDNCRWVTYKEQALNTRNNRFIELNGEKHTVGDWCNILGTVSKCTVYRRVREYGWSYEKALTTPPMKPYERTA